MSVRNTYSSGVGLLLSVVLLACGSRPVYAAPVAELKWQGWNEDVFSQARKARKLVILDLEARWCHWCHVMDRETYADPGVRAILTKHFITVRVDQDARPDLSARYRDYGWPATILFNAAGEEIEKLSGFQSPAQLVPVLNAAIHNPKPHASSQPSTGQAAVASEIPDDVRRELIERHASAIDQELGGLSTSHRYLDPDSVEYAIVQARLGNARDKAWVQKTLRNNAQLIDPVWGGVYQYSTRHDWNHPHFEKIMPSQAANIRLYSLAYEAFGDEQYRRDAERIAQYLNTFLRGADGAYFTSQDADVVPGEHAEGYYGLDDKERRARGVPAVDAHQYARENGMAITALVALFLSTGHEPYLADATNAAMWAVNSRRRKDGGFHHGEDPAEAPYLADSLWMARGLLSLYSATGDRRWLELAGQAIRFMSTEFSNPQGAGFYSSSPKASGLIRPVLRVEDNIALARLANEAFRYSGDDAHQRMASQALSYVAQPQVFRETISEPGILLAATEISSDPPHFTVVGAKGDPMAKQLFSATLKLPTTYVRREWWDRSEGPMPNPDVQYPTVPRAAAFVCANKRCSLPLFTTEELTSRIAEVFATQ